MAEAGEFQIIEKFFTYQTFGAWKSQGVGDDCAIIDTGTGRIAVTCDMMALGKIGRASCRERVYVLV